MTALAGTWRAPARTLPAVRAGRSWSAWFLFAMALALYLGLGLYLALVLHAMHGDAYSRVTNAYYVLFSRDPHLAAIGFVWPPLPTLVELMLVPLKVVWPPMVEQGMAAVLMSAVFMAAAVVQMHGALADFGVPRLPRLLLVGAFALHPMILYYGAIGTSEAPFVFFLVLSARHLARWLRAPDIGALVLVGLGIAGAYLTRYEAMFSAVGAAGLVGLFTIARSPGTRRQRVDAATADVAIVVAPFVLVLVGWALASWIIVGTPFAQFTSAYGNAAQIGVAAAQSSSEQFDPLVVKAGLALRRLGAVEIALPFAVGLAALVGWRRRDDRWLAVVAPFAPALAFMVFGYLTGTLFPWLRFLILAVPMGVLLLGLSIGGRAAESARSGRPVGARRRLVGFLARTAMISVILGAALISLPAAAWGMLDPTIAVEESKDLAGLLSPGAARDDRPGADLRTFATEGEVAAYLDGLDLPRGSVLVDTFSGFAIVGRTSHPERFVITPDTDFKAVLADPRSFGVRYLLAPAANGNGVLDALNVAYPHLGADGDELAVLEHTFAGRGGSSDWRLYRVLEPAPSG
jgi:hypothetical protein